MLSRLPTVSFSTGKPSRPAWMHPAAEQGHFVCPLFQPEHIGVTSQGHILSFCSICFYSQGADMHAHPAPRTGGAANAGGAHLDVAIMRSLMAIHALNRCRFPLHQMDPEERFESHRVIDVRVVRWQVHPSNDEQAIHLQRDGKQHTQHQPCSRPLEFAANGSGAHPTTGQELQNSLLHFQTAFQQLNQTICTHSTPLVKRERVSL